MTYEPREYWTSHGPLTRTSAHIEQEGVLLQALGRIQVKSILEIGVGNGRIAKLLMERWPEAAYTGLDVSPNRLAEARQTLPERAELHHADFLTWGTPAPVYDLVIAVEVLMHVLPENIEEAVQRLKAWSKRHVYTLDWTEPIQKRPGDHNFRHDYEALGLTRVASTGLQGIHRARV